MNQWLSTGNPNPKARLRLFCLPYAGGSSFVYHAWQKKLPPAVEVNRERLEAWEKQTAEAFSLRMLPGQPLFLNTAQEQLLGFIGQDCERLLMREGK